MGGYRGPVSPHGGGMCHDVPICFASVGVPRRLFMRPEDRPTRRRPHRMPAIKGGNRRTSTDSIRKSQSYKVGYPIIQILHICETSFQGLSFEMATTRFDPPAVAQPPAAPAPWVLGLARSATTPCPAFRRIVKPSARQVKQLGIGMDANGHILISILTLRFFDV